jgi:hypothetical protein
MAQIIVMTMVIVAGIAFAPATQAQIFNLKGPKPMKLAQQKSGKLCYKLYRKRTHSKNQVVLASAQRRPMKYKPMAETDMPVRVASLD